MQATDTSTPDRRSFLDRQRDAALAEMAEQQAERKRVADLVLGTDGRSRSRVTDVVKLGGDYLVGVADRNYVVQWTTVVGGKARSLYFDRQEDAILHLIARRYDNNPNSSQGAVFYAGRVLGAPTN